MGNSILSNEEIAAINKVISKYGCEVVSSEKKQECYYKLESRNSFLYYKSYDGTDFILRSSRDLFDFFKRKSIFDFLYFCNEFIIKKYTKVDPGIVIDLSIYHFILDYYKTHFVK